MSNQTELILDEHIAAQVAELFRSFSDVSRVRILSVLVNGELNVGTLAKIVGISESAVSHHMRGLRQMRIVTARKDGKEVYYRVDDKHIIELFQQGVRHVQDE
jgi:ArsR family transcriptional regulator, lead/cadmium/zinc/bismuth-responsive transcriptional repressor